MDYITKALVIIDVCLFALLLTVHVLDQQNQQSDVSESSLSYMNPHQIYSYNVYTDGTTIYAKNGTTGKIDYYGTDASIVINNVTRNGNVTVFVSVGIYDISSSPIYMNNYTTIIGETSRFARSQGSPTTKINAVTFKNNGFHLNGTEDMFISYLTISPGSGKDSIYTTILHYRVNVRVEGVLLYQGYDGVNLTDGCMFCYFKYNTFQGQTHIGLNINYTSGPFMNNVVHVIGGEYRESGVAGISISKGAAVTIKDINVEANKKDGIILDTIYSSTISGIYFESNNFTLGGGSDIKLIAPGQSNYDTVIENNYFGVGSAIPKINVTLGTTRNLILKGNMFNSYAKSISTDANTFGVVLINNYGITSNSTLPASTIILDGNGNVTTTFLNISKAGGGISVKEGSNAKQGTATLSSGSILVSNTAVTSNSRIFLTLQDCVSCGTPYISAVNSSSNFTISSTNVSDGSIVAYEIFEPS